MDRLLAWPRALCAALTVAASVVFAPRTALADIERFGLLIGNNRGDIEDSPLRYAASDAERMSEVLSDLGGFSPVNLVLLRDANAETARRTLIALNDRIRASASRPDTQVVLLVYYSGHADNGALHLGASRFDLSELEQLVRGSAANFRVLLIDACRSGALTRVKGGVSAPPFPIRMGERLDGQGVVFLTSSSENEDAQESDGLRGSFFTHYFVSGLMGAADFDGDGRVDLDEAYRYAYEATLRSTSRTWAGTQHPTFRFELAGQGRIVLTEPQRLSERATFVFPGARAYLVFRGSANGPAVGEVTATTNARRFTVRAGRYFVRGRAPDYVLEGELVVAEGQALVVDDDLLRRFEYARLVRKGGAEAQKASGPLAGYTMRTALKNGTALCNGAFVGYAFAFTALTVTPRLDACFSGFNNESLRANVSEYGGDVRVVHAWDLPALTVDIGFAVGASWLRQTFTTSGIAPARDTLSPRISVGSAVTRDVAEGFYVVGDGAAETYLFRVEEGATGSVNLTPSLALRAHLGVGKQW
jgi:hypothetical protein